jgi:hypothetical protein
MRPVLAPIVAVGGCWVASLLTTADAWPLPPGVLRIAAADALLIETALLVVAAPVAGVAIARDRSGGVLRRFAVLIGAFVATSLVAALAAAWMSGATMTYALRSHATLAAVALALTSLGAWLSTWCPDILDAGASAIGVSIALSALILVAGPATADLPQAVVDAALLASPPVAVSSAAGIDLLRSEVLYQLSPISHRRFTYPAWTTSAATYALVAVFFLGVARKASST